MSTSFLRRTLVTAAIGIVVSATAVGCAPPGSSSGGTATGGSGGAAAESIKVGLLTPTSGTYAALGTSINAGFQLYLDQHGGKLGGKTVEVVTADSQADPAAAVRETNRLIDRDEVDVVVGMVSSGVAVAVRDVVDAKQKPTIISMASADAIAGDKWSPYVFRPSKTNHMLGQAMGTWAPESTCKSAAVLGADYAAGREVVGGFKAAFTAAGGTITSEAYPALGNADYSSFLAPIAQAKPECVMTFFAGSDAVRFVEQYVSFGLGSTPLLGTGALFDEEDVLPSIKGDLPKPSYSAFHQSPSYDGAANQEFVKLWNEKTGHNPGESSTGGWVSAQLLDEALKTASLDDIQKFGETVRGLKLETALGPMTFDDHNQARINIYINEVVPGGQRYTNKVIATIPPEQLKPTATS